MDTVKKVKKKRKDHKVKHLDTPRHNKNLLVLDLDLTLCDKNPYPTRNQKYVARPFIKYFLRQVYKKYDIIIWSATRLKTLKNKLKLFNLLKNPGFKILCYLGRKAMVPVIKHGHVKCHTKDLNVIWKMFPQFNAKNTILIDDKKSNFKHNRECGLLIKPFKALNYTSIDSELLLVLRYVLAVASNYEDYYPINHRKWRRNA